MARDYWHNDEDLADEFRNWEYNEREAARLPRHLVLIGVVDLGIEVIKDGMFLHKEQYVYEDGHKEEVGSILIIGCQEE